MTFPLLHKQINGFVFRYTHSLCLRLLWCSAMPSAVLFLHLPVVLVRCGIWCWFLFHFCFIYMHFLFIYSSVCGFFCISLLIRKQFYSQAMVSFRFRKVIDFVLIIYVIFIGVCMCVYASYFCRN